MIPTLILFVTLIVEAQWFCFLGGSKILDKSNFERLSQPGNFNWLYLGERYKGGCV